MKRKDLKSAEKQNVLFQEGFVLLVSNTTRHFWDSFVHLILPGLAIAMPAIGNVSRLTRTNLSDIYDKQYIEFAFSYTTRRIFRHRGG